MIRWNNIIFVKDLKEQVDEMLNSVFLMLKQEAKARYL